VFTTQIVLIICGPTLILVGIILGILIKRHGHTLETEKILREMENVRAQNSAEHSKFEHVQRDHGNKITRLLGRYGFWRND
jgi:hypothetical protein